GRIEAGRAAEQNDMQRPEDGGNGDEKIALREGLQRAPAQEPRAREGGDDGEPDERRGPAADETPGDERRHDHIERGEEAGVGDAGGDEAGLLQDGTGEEGEARRKGGGEQVRPGGGRCRAALAPGEGGEGN